jgi:hypothetical protein
MDDLDRLIDEAARQMAQREPPEALAGAVMERVSSGARPFVWSRRQWGGLAAAGVVITALVMFVGENRTRPSTEAPLQAQGPVQRSRLMAQDSGKEHAVDSPTESPRVAVVASRRDAMTPDEIDGQIEDPILFEAISPEPIEVEPIDVATASIDPIQTFPIEIEPISSSND